MSVALVVGGVGSASASMSLPSPTFTVDAEGFGGVADFACTSVERPGTRALGDLIKGASGYTYGGLTRACDAPGYEKSDHKMGRALDVMIDYDSSTGRVDAQTLVTWLFANKAERLRRLGIVQVIWGGATWTTARDTGNVTSDLSTWRDYTGGGCTGKSDTDAAHANACHRDHVHLSLSVAGSEKTSTWWTSQNVAPVGSLERASQSGTLLVAEGWASDGNTPSAALTVRVSDKWASGSQEVKGAAGTYRTGIGSHGYTLGLPIKVNGVHTVCAYVADTTTAVETRLGCKDVNLGSDPTGVLSAVVRSGSSLSARGSAWDPDAPSAALSIRLTDSWTKGSTTGSQQVRGVAAASTHLYTVSLPIRSAGVHRVCSYATDASTGVERLLGCRSITVI